jgi:hypothetical protein
MTAPRHISTCIDEWLDGCPFNRSDAVMAIRQELEMAARTTPTKREPATVQEVLQRHAGGDQGEMGRTA